MIIDIHAHVYMDPRIIPIRAKETLLSAENQIAIMDKLGVDKAVILPLNNAENLGEPQSIGEILAICDKYPGRFIPFCNLDPRLPRKPEMAKLEEYEMILKQYKDLGGKGLGELIARVPWDDPNLHLMLKACENLYLPVTFHTITDSYNGYGVIDDIGLPRFEKVLQKFPDLPFLGHSAGFWSEISGNILGTEEKDHYPNDAVKPDGAIPRFMRKYPNLNGDISAGSGFNAITRDKEFGYKFMDEFQDRLLLGLDFCATTNDMQHISYLQQCRDDGKISEEVYEKIVWKNANRILKLEL